MDSRPRRIHSPHQGRPTIHPHYIFGWWSMTGGWWLLRPCIWPITSVLVYTRRDWWRGRDVTDTALRSIRVLYLILFGCDWIWDRPLISRIKDRLYTYIIHSLKCYQLDLLRAMLKRFRLERKSISYPDNLSSNPMALGSKLWTNHSFIRFRETQSRLKQAIKQHYRTTNQTKSNYENVRYGSLAAARPTRKYIKLFSLKATHFLFAFCRCCFDKSTYDDIKTTRRRH